MGIKKARERVSVAINSQVLILSRCQGFSTKNFVRLGQFNKKFRESRLKLASAASPASHASRKCLEMCDGKKNFSGTLLNDQITCDMPNAAGIRIPLTNFPTTTIYRPLISFCIPYTSFNFYPDTTLNSGKVSSLARFLHI
jgi:hypothetical protein